MSIDPRLVDRRKEVAEGNAKRNVGRLLKFLLFLVVMGLGVWTVFSPWLSVSRVVASGIATSDANTVLAENGVTAGTPMILIDASDVETALLDDPWVAQASVRLRWPDEVTVDIVERVPAAWVRTADGWARRAPDGVAVPSAPEPDDDMARIDFPDMTDAEATTSTDLLGALEFVGALPADLHRGTVLTRNDGELWASVSGFQVRLGRSADMTEKALSLDALLSQQIPEGSTLILIAPTNPAVMTPEPPEAGESGSGDDGSGEGSETGASGEEGADEDL